MERLPTGFPWVDRAKVYGQFPLPTEHVIPLIQQPGESIAGGSGQGGQGVTRVRTGEGIVPLTSRRFTPDCPDRPDTPSPSY